MAANTFSQPASYWLAPPRDLTDKGTAAFLNLQAIQGDWGARTATAWAANLAEAMDAPDVAERLRAAMEERKRPNP